MPENFIGLKILRVKISRSLVWLGHGIISGLVVMAISWLFIVSKVTEDVEIFSPPLSSDQSVSPTPTIEVHKPFGIYQPPSLPKKEAYTIILVGDSMIKSLGPNSDKLRIQLGKFYPETVFGIFNYGFSASNILSLEERLIKDMTDDGNGYQAILNRQFDVLIVESFGYNPLSDLDLEEGLKTQAEVLDRTMSRVTETHPESVVVFLAVMAPNKLNYGKGTVELSDDKRREWAEERMKYMENHIRYAKEHAIPLINVYEKSLVNGDGNLTYINQDDFIHPSAAGVELISKEIAEYLAGDKILPN